MQGGAKIVWLEDLPVGWSSRETHGAVRKIKKINNCSTINIFCVISCFKYSVTPPILTITSSQSIWPEPPPKQLSKCFSNQTYSKICQKICKMFLACFKLFWFSCMVKLGQNAENHKKISYGKFNSKELMGFFTNKYSVNKKYNFYNQMLLQNV